MLINEQTKPLNLSISQSRVLALVLSVVLFLCVSTNLRVSGLPVGVGEIGLLLLMIVSIFMKPWQRVSSPLFLFWLAVWGCTALGYAFGNVVGSLRLHNAVAYAYTGLLTLAFVTVFARLKESDLRRILFCFVVISLVALWLGFLAYLNFDQATLASLRIDTSDNGRYQGWCQNANQMSLLLVPMPFLVLDLWANSPNKTKWLGLGWLALLFLVVFMGLVVRSATLTASWALGLIVLGLLNLKRPQNLNWKAVVAVLLVFLAGFVSVRALTHQGALGATGQNNALQVGMGSSDQKVDIRMQLWKNALQVWEKSPIVGHGPGAYSQFDMTETQSFSGMEAHNTLIDLMVQGGVLLGLGYICLFIWLATSLWGTRQLLLLVSVIALFSFEFFMFHLRQPVLWFYLVLVLAISKAFQNDNRAGVKS